MGANTLMISPVRPPAAASASAPAACMTLTPQDADEIARQCPAVSDVAPIGARAAQVVYGNRNWVPKQINGTTPSYLAVRDWENMDEGEMFTDRDVRNGNKVCVIGADAEAELFQGESPIGKEIRIQNVSFRVVGVLEPQGREHDGHGPGRHRAGPLDDHQVPRQRHHA